MFFLDNEFISYSKYSLNIHVMEREGYMQHHMFPVIV